jgi:hypothetical protein
MNYDEIYGEEPNANDNDDNPVNGLGKEMLPERGIPFDDDDPTAGSVTDFFEDSAVLDSEKPRNLTPEDVADLWGKPFAPGDELTPSATITEEDDGMGAIEPVLPEGGEKIPGVPIEEIPIPDIASIPGMPHYEPPLGEIGPTSDLPKVSPPKTTRHLEAQEAMVDFFVTEEVLRNLWFRIERAGDNVRSKVPNMDIARRLMDQVERARNEILGGRENYEEAERSIQEVELQIGIIERAKEESKYARYLFAYLIYWLVFVVAGWIWLIPGIRDVILQALGPDTVALFPTLDTDLLVGAQTMLVGALGGIVGALFALVRHISTRLDFSRQYSMWYLTNPIMGMVWGGFAFMVMRAGMLSLTAGSEPQDITSAWTLYLLAFIVGFQQNVANDIIRRILKIFQLETEGQPDSGTEMK